MNNIPQEQNNLRQLERLAAQHQLYSDAKLLQLISIVISVPLAILASILVAIFPKTAAFAGLYGIITTLLDILVFSRLQKSVQERAAKIQQLFDYDILQFDQSRLDDKINIEPEIIIDASNKFKRKDSTYSTLQDWYPVRVGQQPLYIARIICQRSNILWDSQLRQRYSNWLIIVFIVLTVIVFLIGLIGGLTLEKFVLAVLNPLTPAFVFGCRQYIEHKEAATRLDQLRENAEALLQEVKKKLSPHDIETKSYSLQAQIYDNRRRSPLIFDWLYFWLKRKDEERMNKGAEALIQELDQNP